MPVVTKELEIKFLFDTNHFRRGERTAKIAALYPDSSDSRYTVGDITPHAKRMWPQRSPGCLLVPLPIPPQERLVINGGVKIDPRLKGEEEYCYIVPFLSLFYPKGEIVWPIKRETEIFTFLLEKKSVDFPGRKNWAFEYVRPYGSSLEESQITTEISFLKDRVAMTVIRPEIGSTIHICWEQA